MSNPNKKVFVFAIFVAAVLLLLIYLAINFLPPREQHLHGGGFKSVEKSVGNLEAGIIEPKEIGESDIEIKTEENKK